MAIRTLTLNTDSIHYQVRKAVGELCSSAENIRLVASAVEDTAGELPGSAPSEELRRVAAVVKTQALGMLLSAARIANKAERLKSMADVRAAADPPIDEDEL